MGDKKEEPAKFEVNCEKWKKGKAEREKKQADKETLENLRDPVYGSDEWFEREKKRLENVNKDRQTEQKDLFEDMDATYKSKYLDSEDYIMTLLPDYKGIENEGGKEQKSDDKKAKPESIKLPETETLNAAKEVEEFKEKSYKAASKKIKEDQERVKEIAANQKKRHEEEANERKELLKKRAERDEKLEKEREAEKNKLDEERKKKIQQLQDKVGNE